MRVLITGGAGYIGSHTAVALLEAGYEPILYDNFSNSHREVSQRIEQISGKRIELVEGDVRDRITLAQVLSSFHCDAVIHLAGKKAVSESVRRPIEYYDHNVTGTIRLLEAMHDVGVKTLVFSSSATVYGKPQRLPLTESHPLSANSPYGRTKIIVEEMLQDVFLAETDWKIAILRYFNPVGAHESGLIGEDPSGIPNNLMPYITQVAIGRLPYLQIFGGDYPTPDGTGVRDYIHVMDLAEGHLAALSAITKPQCEVYNLGTGRGTTVLEIVRMFEKVSGREIPYRITSRRPGDVAACWADPSKANQQLGWRARRNLEAMCRDSWNWQSKNPMGYKELP